MIRRPAQVEVMMRSLIPAVIILLFSAGALLGSEKSAQNKYKFFLNGDAIEPELISLNGTPEEPCQGDVFNYSLFYMVLGPPGEYRFRTVENEEHKLLRETADGDRLAAVSVG